jgi:NADPH-dependent 2,4-dienoyl-CoA reductase/sulfur reductase-like enzyme
MNTCTIAIVGGGTAGLSLATRLCETGIRNVVVLEREAEAGGIPRHCGHYPFGVREYKRLLKGPDYAARNVARARAAGVDIRTNTTVTALHPNARLSLATADGQSELQAQRVVLCTGVRESSRAQRFLSGQRPLGILSTGALQSMVFLQHKRPFKRPVILGSELVSFSAIMTCAHMGIKPAAMIEENPEIHVRKIMRPYPAIKRIPLHTGARDLRILGGKTVEAVTFTDSGGQPRQIDTDGVIVSGHFRPESALLHASHLRVDPATGGPEIDQFGRASDPAYFCTGNLLRPVETSSWCWHEAAETAARLADDLANPIGDTPQIHLQADDPAIRFVLPQQVSLTDRSGGMTQMQLRLGKPASGCLSLIQNGETLWSNHLSSRPERRIFAPLFPLASAATSATVNVKLL